MSDYHQPGYGPQAGGPQQPYGAQPGWNNGAPPGGGYGYPSAPGGYGYPSDPGYGQGYQQGYDGRPPANSTGPAMWAHLGALLTITAGSAICCGLGAFLGWIVPMSIRSNDRHKHDPYIRHHATEGMNFGITQAIMSAIGLVLYFASAIIFSVAADSFNSSSGGLAVPLLTVVVLMGVNGLAAIVCAIIGTIKATRGELWTYPRLLAWPMIKG
ncbi:DUF4870 domain-containing protein [Streptomyces sp. NPDC101393]|uniref:DUF4870 domain-containing protein n=1 Tax=Streptomyces sp. NPDC101393 TaxID=3366141 RepID=UPI00380DCCA8